MKSRLLVRTLNILSALAISATVTAQDIHFSQFYETSILRNPALTGIFAGDYKVGAVCRSQWNSISKPFQTGMVSAETHFPINSEVNDFVSVGLLAYYDRAGSVNMQTLTVYPAINYNKSLEDENNSFLSVGFTGGFIQRSFDPTKMTFDNDYDHKSREAIPAQQFSQWDLGAGIVFTSNGKGDENNFTYYIGASGYHFTQPKNSFFNNDAINLKMRLNGTAGMSMKLNETSMVQFHANYMQQGTYSEVIAGGMLGWIKNSYSGDPLLVLNGGVFYRFKDAVIPVVEVKYKDFSFGVSYDVNVSKLKAGTNLRGGFEVTLFKTGLFNNPKFERSRTICPRASW